jgi:alpha-D-xyloside xylohydrolase
MKIPQTSLLAFLVLFLLSCSSFKKDLTGITFFPSRIEKNGARLIRIDVITPDIIHIRAFPEKKIIPKVSLVVNEHNNIPDFKWDIIEKRDSVIIITDKLSVKINKKNGKIDFYDKQGNRKLSEIRDKQSQFFIAKKLEGKDYYAVRQIFDSPADEAIYGLGAHQNGDVNYKGKDVVLMQHNIVDVVPFLVSSKNYGLLWDNYSITKFGDSRDYRPISILKLYGRNQEPGGLTATYYSRIDRKEIFITRQEKEIGYKYQDDLSGFPEKFPFNKGLVEWQGFMEADTPGIYKFITHSAGYLKLWINNELIIDCWRQAWNPWTNKFNIHLRPGVKIPVTIEWIPDGGISYIALECLTPYGAEGEQELSLFSEAGKSIDYYFINGSNADEIIRGYRQITGKAPIMPLWAMGLWQSRERYKTQNELLDVVKEYRKRNIPLDNIVLDWFYWEEDKWGDHGFDRKRFPDPEGMITEIHKKLNARIMISVWPKFYKNTHNYEIMDKNGWLYPENIIRGNKDWVGSGYLSTFYDAFNADARREYWKQIHDSLFVKGIDAWWMDATEPDIESNTSPETRKKLMSPVALGPSEEYFNVYSLMHTQGVYEGQRSVSPDKRVFILTRSAFAGQQRNAAAVWSGDVASRWVDLKNQIAAGINMAASGIPYWTTDIGGFSLERRFENAAGKDLDEWRELNLRWFQFGAFCPLFRIHGQYPFREIFNIAPENHSVYKSMVFYDKLRYRLMPYIYSLAGMTYHNDYTIMRPLFMDHASDTTVYKIKDEFMFGPELLICPVYSYTAREKEVYLPATSGWYDLLTGEYYKGGKFYKIKAPLEKIPVFANEGAIIISGPEIQYTGEKPADPLIVYVFDGKDGHFSLYEDDGLTYNYEKGMFSTIDFTYNSTMKTLKVSEVRGSYPEMLKEREIIIKLITQASKGGIDFSGLMTKSIKYSGIAVELKLQ